MEEDRGVAAVRRLLQGFADFRDRYFGAEAAGLYEALVREGQSPRVMVIACSDSRADPALVTRAEPGDLFVLRNVAALAPPYVLGGGPKGASAAIEYGVRGLEVEHLIVLGHSHCGGVALLGRRSRGEEPPFDFLSDWMSTMDGAAYEVDHDDPATSPAERQERLEKAVVRQSVRNLNTFPWISERVDAGKLALHGWRFDLEGGELQALSPKTGRFHAVAGDVMPEPACFCPSCRPSASAAALSTTKP